MSLHKRELCSSCYILSTTCIMLSTTWNVKSHNIISAINALNFHSKLTSKQLQQNCISVSIQIVHKLTTSHIHANILSLCIPSWCAGSPTDGYEPLSYDTAVGGTGKWRQTNAYLLWSSLDNVNCAASESTYLDCLNTNVKVKKLQPQLYKNSTITL